MSSSAHFFRGEDMVRKNGSINTRSKVKKDSNQTPIDLFEQQNIRNILENLPSTLFVTDKEGNVLLSTSFTALTLGISLDELLKSNLKDLVKRGLYNKSFALGAVQEKKRLSGEITTKSGLRMVTTSTPILDNNDEVIFVVTSGRPKELGEEYCEKEKKEIEKRLKREIEYLRNQKNTDSEIVAESLAMRQIFKKCQMIAKTDSTVLLFGESGTGKEVLSRYIYNNSLRAEGPFISVNCAAIPEALFESELFGYEKGAFTGANSGGKVGLFEIAHEGTLFLDEISEMPLPLQAKLLRVLDSNEVRRVGGTTTRHVDFRLITATNRDLAEMVEKGEFRRDLFYRINVISINIPPLRQRPEDLIALVDKFLKGFNKKYRSDYKLNQKEIQFLLKHDWPGNIRELRNFIERAVVSNNSLSEIADDQPVSSPEINWLDVPLDRNLSLKEFVKAAEESYIRKTLAECNGKIGETANRLGIYRTVLYRKLKSFQEDSKPE